MKKDLVYTLLRSEKKKQEGNYLKYINNATDSELNQRTNNIRVQAAKIDNLLNKEERKIIEKNYTSLNTKKDLEEHKNQEQLLILLIWQLPSTTKKNISLVNIRIIITLE